MRVLVVYESMFGNTRTIAEAIAAGLSGATDVVLAPIRAVTPEQVAAADLLVDRERDPDRAVPILEKMVAEAEQSRAQVEVALGEAEAKRGAAEAAAGEAEAKRGEAEAARGDAEARKGEAEAAHTRHIAHISTWTSSNRLLVGASGAGTLTGNSTARFAPRALAAAIARSTARA